MSTVPDTDKAMLERRALAIRRNVLRLIKAGRAGHVGGALSVADALAVLYFKVMKCDPDQPDMPDRDRLVLSAGHKCLALYASLAEKGYFDKSLLDTYGSIDSPMPGHPDMHKLPGVESNTGALGHGLSIGGGMALGLKMDFTGDSTPRVFVVMGDGELAEGSNWEAAAAAGHHKLDNIVVLVDRNGLQISGRTVDVMSYEPLADKWQSFGWSVRTIDGHDLGLMVDMLQKAPLDAGKPTCLILDTVKAKGLSFAEGKTSFHYWKATDDQIAQAEEDLNLIERRLGA